MKQSAIFILIYSKTVLQSWHVIPIDASWLQKRGLVGEFSIERNPLSFERAKGRIWQEIGEFCLQNKSYPKGEAAAYCIDIIFFCFLTASLETKGVPNYISW